MILFSVARGLKVSQMAAIVRASEIESFLTFTFAHEGGFNVRRNG
jgi:hypothetical protein